MSGKTYGLGIIGIGAVTETHVCALAELPNARLVAACCRTADKGRAFAQKYACDYVADYRQLCRRDDVDIVSICTPSGAHAEPAIAAAAAGKHVICEKPLEITLERVDRMITAADEAKVKLGGIFQLRFSPAVHQIKQALQAGRFGRLSFAAGFVPWWRDQNYYDQGVWKGTQALDGGGALMNQAIHVVDMLQYLAGPVKRVQAATARLAHQQIEVEDTAVATLEYENSALGLMLAATSMYPGRYRRLEISGDTGSAVLLEEDLLVWQFAQELPEDADIRRRFTGVNASRGGDSVPNAINCRGHRRNYESFFHALDSDSEPPLNGREARKAVELVLAIYRSAQLARPVELPLLDVDTS